MKKNGLNEKVMDYAKNFNRSKNQVSFLLGLLSYDFGQYEDLEFAIKKFHVFYCPDDVWECRLLAAKYRTFKFI